MTVPPTVDGADAEEFLDKVSEVSILIEGLAKGTISPEYVDKKVGVLGANKPVKEEAAKPAPALHAAAEPAAAPAGSPDAAAAAKTEEEEAAKRERLMEKAAALKANYERKLKARERFAQYTADGSSKSNVGTDYTKWDMWCPEDEEDELINSITPNSSAFKALEKDIDERHNKMVAQRQVAERMRVLGNNAFKAKQYTEALRCYEEGLSSEKTNMALHSNAAMAALKINCYVQAIEHCDKALNIADFLHNNLKDTLCTKTYQRRATAYRALQQYGRAVQDLEAAAANDPDSKEIQQQLAKARLDYEEHRKQKAVKKAMRAEAGAGEGAAARAGEEAATQATGKGAPADGVDIEKLRRVEQLVRQLQKQTEQDQEQEQQLQAAGGEGQLLLEAAVAAHRTGQREGVREGGEQASGSGGPATAGTAAAAARGPQLPARPTTGKKDGKSKGAGSGDKGKEPGQGAGLGTQGTGPAGEAGPSQEVVAACTELLPLLHDDDLACVYLRECGGLQAAAKVALDASPASSSAGASCLGLLNAACANDGNLLQLPSLGVLPAAVRALGGTDKQVAEAAVRLLCTAVTNDDVRREVSKALGAANGLHAVFGILQRSGERVQAMALAVLGNCMVDASTKDAMRRLLLPSSSPSSAAPSPSPSDPGPSSEPPLAPGAVLVALVSSPSAAVREKAITLCGNMCGDAALRAQLASLDGLLAAAAGAALTAPAAAAAATSAGQQLLQVQLAAAALLYNLSLDPAAQQALLQERDMAEASAAGAAAAAAETAPSACREGQVPAGGSHVDALLALASAPGSDLRLAARLAGVAARCSKHASRPRQLPGSMHLDRLVALLRRCCGGSQPSATTATSSSSSQSGASGHPQQQQGGGGTADGEDSPAASAVDAAVRCLTTLTQDEAAADAAAAAQALLRLGATELLLGAIQQLQVSPASGSSSGTASFQATTSPTASVAPEALHPSHVSKRTRDSILGNATLCLGHLAREPEALPLLQRLDAVRPLVGVAYEGKGSAASKNAAIALARMAREPKMLERLRELHGIEIIYQYVKP